MCAFDSTFPPACAICCSCLSVSICGRKPVGTEDAPKRSEESLVKSDQDGDCRWTTGSRRLGTAPTTNLVLELVHRWHQREEFAGRLKENRAAS